MRFWFCHIQTAYESDLDIGVFYSLQASINSAIFHIIFSLLKRATKAAHANMAAATPNQHEQTRTWIHDNTKPSVRMGRKA
jgi:hypothetical protein